MTGRGGVRRGEVERGEARRGGAGRNGTEQVGAGPSWANLSGEVETEEDLRRSRIWVVVRQEYIEQNGIKQGKLVEVGQG